MYRLDVSKCETDLCVLEEFFHIYFLVFSCLAFLLSYLLHSTYLLIDGNS